MVLIKGWVLSCDTSILFSKYIIQTTIQSNHTTTSTSDILNIFKYTQSKKSNMSDSSSPPRRHWNGPVGARHEHQNVWLNGGVRSPAPPAPWSGWDADRKRRVRPLTPLNYLPQLTLTFNCRDPNHPQNQTKAATPAATENRSLRDSIPKSGEVSRTRAMSRDGRVMRRCCLRKAFLGSCGIGLRRGRSDLSIYRIVLR